MQTHKNTQTHKTHKHRHTIHIDTSRAGRYLGSTTVLESDDTCIIQIPEKRYYRFWYYRGFTKSGNSF